MIPPFLLYDLPIGVSGQGCGPSSCFFFSEEAHNNVLFTDTELLIPLTMNLIASRQRASGVELNKINPS